MNESNELMQNRGRFKPLQHPESPYARAQDEWNDRTGSLVKNARSWRIATFAALGVATAAVGGLTYQSVHSTVQPYYIRVADNGQPLVVGPVPDIYKPQSAEIRYFLDEWIQWTRAVPLDPVVVKHNYGKALLRMRQAAANKLNEWAQKEPRLMNVGRETVSVQTIGVVPVSGTNSYQARWVEEHRNSEGGLKSRETWTATFTIDLDPPKTERQIAVNPIGMYIRDFQWTREL